MRAKPWQRLLWGVVFSGDTRDRPMLLGTGWNGPDPAAYPGEPTRALLFMSRSAARAWCATKQASYAGRTDCCATWRFRPMRVRETIAAAIRHQEGA